MKKGKECVGSVDQVGKMKVGRREGRRRLSAETVRMLREKVATAMKRRLQANRFTPGID